MEPEGRAGSGSDDAMAFCVDRLSGRDLRKDNSSLIDGRIANFGLTAPRFSSALRKRAILYQCQDFQCHFLCSRRGTDTRRASVFARAFPDKLGSGGEHLFADLVQGPAQPDSPRIVVVDEDRWLEGLVLNPGVHRGAEVPPVAHEKHAGEAG